MPEPPKVIWPDKSQFGQFAENLKERRTSPKTKNLPLAVEERKFDNSIRSPDKQDVQRGRAKASFSDEELKRQYKKQAAKAAAAPEVLVEAAAPDHITPVKLSDETIASMAADIGPPWDE